MVGGLVKQTVHNGCCKNCRFDGSDFIR